MNTILLLFFFLLLFCFFLQTTNSTGVFQQRLHDEIEAMKAEIAQKKAIEAKLDVKLKQAGLCFPKQPIENLVMLANDYKMAFDNEWTETGAVVLPDKKLVICSYPKAGCSTAKWIILALMGYENRAEICADLDGLHMDHQQYLSKGLKYIRDMHPPSGTYQGPKDIKCGANNSLDIIDDWKNVPHYFLDPSWTTVAFTRDPWYRVVSMYHDQMKRNHLPKRWKHNSIINFTNFINSYTNIRGHWSEGFKHTGDAVNYCGLKYIKYDHYIDIDHMEPGLQKLMKVRPDFIPYITKGWENCTHGNDPSLVTGMVKQSHQADNYTNNIELKNKLHDSWFCSNETVGYVYHRYIKDYLVYGDEMNYTKHSCLV